MEKSKLKNRLKKRLGEAKFVVSPEQIDQVADKLGPEDVVKVTNETDGEDYEAASREVEYGVSPEAGEHSKEEWEELMRQIHTEPEGDVDSNMNEEEGEAPKVDKQDLKADVQRLLDKMNLESFKKIFARIDKPIEQAELILAFAERVGIPREKLPAVFQSMRSVAENVNPRMKKRDLVEMLDKTNSEVIKTVKVKDIK